MANNKTVSLTLTLPKRYRDILRKQSGQWIVEHPDERISGASIAAGIVIEYLDNWLKEQSENDVQIAGKGSM